jgi:hypothetical protein
MLELAFHTADGQRRKEIIASLPKEMSYIQDGELKTVKRELLLTEAIETTGLVQTEVANVVAEGSASSQCWQKVMPVYNIKGNAYMHAIGEAEMYAAEVPEAAEIPNRTQDYGVATFAIKKYAQSPKISNEMVEDAMVNVIEEEIKYAAKAVTNKVEQICNNEFLEHATSNWDTLAANQGVRAVASAIAILRGAGFMPDAVVMHPELEAMCMRDMIPGNFFPGQSVGTGDALMPQGYLGIKWATCGVADVAGGTYTWDYDADNEVGGLVVDSSRAGGIAVARPLTVKQYEDPVHDLQGMSISMRMDAKTFAPTALCRITF